MTVERHFQFDDRDPEARRALAVLTAWEQQGYTTDEVVKYALLALGDGKAPADRTSTLVANIKDILRQGHELLLEMRALNIARAQEPPAGMGDVPSPQPQASQEPQLSAAFLEAVKKAARPGLRLEG